MANKITNKRAIEKVATVLFFAGLLLYMAWPWVLRRTHPEPKRRTLVVYGFSVLQEVMNQKIFPAFQRHWEQQTQESIQILGSFSGSGTTTNHILLGAPAQVALLSNEGDAQRLQKAGLAKTDWRSFPQKGIINRSPIIIIVRRGNPKKVRDFSDLAKGDIKIIHPDPLTSGAAVWSLLAEYGSALERTQTLWGHSDPEAAYRQLEGIWRRITAQTGSARGARMQFESGFGDALITYEQEAVADMQAKRFSAEVIVPPATIYTEHVAVIVDRNVAPADRTLVNEFVNFLWTDAAQQMFVMAGFRSITREDFNQANRYFKPVAHPFTVADLGGWDQAYQSIVEEIWQQRVLQEMRP